MSSNTSVQVSWKSLNDQYKLLSIYNLDLSNFLYLFKKSKVTRFQIYWSGPESDFITSSKDQLPVFDLEFKSQVEDARISSVEIKLNNGLLIDSNMEDEIFCKIPEDYLTTFFVDKIQSIGSKRGPARKPLPIISLQDRNVWDTREVEV